MNRLYERRMRKVLGRGEKEPVLATGKVGKGSRIDGLFSDKLLNKKHIYQFLERLAGDILRPETSDGIILYSYGDTYLCSDGRIAFVLSGKYLSVLAKGSNLSKVLTRLPEVGETIHYSSKGLSEGPPELEGLFSEEGIHYNLYPTPWMFRYMGKSEGIYDVVGGSVAFVKKPPTKKFSINISGATLVQEHYLKFWGKEWWQLHFTIEKKQRAIYIRTSERSPLLGVVMPVSSDPDRIQDHMKAFAEMP